MTTIQAVAKAFLKFESMSPKKLQKLCYYAYGWYLVLYDKPLFLNAFEAWVHGPVDPSLHQEYRDYGWAEIPLNQEDPPVSSEVFAFVEEVYASYGEMTADQLEALTHSEPPWQQARNGLPVFATCTRRISDTVIADFHRSLLDSPAR